MSCIELAVLENPGRPSDPLLASWARVSSAFRLDLERRLDCNPPAALIELVSGPEGTSVPVAFARADALPQWGNWLLDHNLPPLTKHDIVGARVAPAGIEASLTAFGQAFGMRPSVVRALVALYRTCDVKAAAELAGIGYETARENLDLARKAVGAANSARLLTISIIGAFDTLNGGSETDSAFSSVFGLTERQTRLSALITNGSTRREAAEILGISDPVAKVELTNIFASTGVSSNLALARLAAEFRVLTMATDCESSAEAFAAPASKSFFLVSIDGRTIAVSDYGPANGSPVLVLHSSMTSRPVNRALVEELQNAGMRPVSIDRPGFGDSDIAPPSKTPGDYFKLAADDMALLCQHMDWPSVRLITRGAAQIALAFARNYPQLLDRAVILNPDPDTTSSNKSAGIMPAIKRNFAKRPWAVAAMARPLAALSSYERIRDNLLRMTRDCPAEAAAMRDPANVADYYRGCAAFKHGRIDGFVREQVDLATTGKPAQTLNSEKFSVLIGSTDFIHDPVETESYWRDVLPWARFQRVENGGRFLAYTHAALAVEEFARD